jgi:hypothetical protein
LYGGGVVVASKTNVFQKDRVQRRIGKRIDRLRHTGSSGLDRDIVVLVKINTGMLNGSVFSVTKKFFFDAHVTTANDMLSVFPNTIPECLTLTACMMRFFSPLTTTTPTTTGRRETAAASPIAESTPVATAGWGRRSLGACPIIPASKPLSGGRIDMMTKNTYTTGG